MEIFSENLIKSKELEKRIVTTCSFNNAKCEFTQGRILSIDKTNVSFIEPHRVDVTIKDKKLLLIYFDKNNLFLYNRSMPITIRKLDTLLKEVKAI
ncbi:MAG: hypothetical protein WDA12_02985 [Bacilli bacterium]